MFQGSVPHHDTGGFKSHRIRLPDAEYGIALDCIVKACSDMLLVSADGSKVLLGRRIVYPQPDWWFVGGRIMPGETPTKSCSRLLKRELGLDIDPLRLQAICSQSLAWGMREQQPKDHGTTDLQVVFMLQLTEAEETSVVLDPKEYSDSGWFEPAEIVDQEEKYHPALRFAVSSLLAQQACADLRKAVADGAEDAEIAALARAFVQRADVRCKSGASAYGNVQTSS